MGIDSLIFLAIVASYIIPTNWWLKKKLNIAGKRSSSFHVNKTHKLIERIIMIIAIIGGLLLIPKGVIAFYWLISSIIIITLIRAIMEWKYDRKSKVYILSLNGVIAYILMAVGIIVFIVESEGFS